MPSLLFVPGWLERRHIKKNLADALKTYSGRGIYGLEPSWIGNRRCYGSAKSGSWEHVRLLHSLNETRLMVTTYFDPEEVFRNGEPKPAVVGGLLVGSTFNSDFLDPKYVFQEGKLNPTVRHALVRSVFNLDFQEPLSPAMEVLISDIKGQAWTDREIRVADARQRIKMLSSGDLWFALSHLGNRAIELWSQKFPLEDLALSEVDDVGPYFEYLRANIQKK